MSLETVLEVNTTSAEDIAPQILIVDPDDLQAAALQTLLRRAGVTTGSHRVSTFLEAMDYLKGDGTFASRSLFPLPSIVFLSMETNGYLGYKLLEWIRTQHETADCALIVCSELSGVLDLSKCYRLGAKTFLLKPYNFQEIKNMVQHFPSFWKSSPRRPQG